MNEFISPDGYQFSLLSTEWFQSKSVVMQLLSQSISRLEVSGGALLGAVALPSLEEGVEEAEHLLHHRVLPKVVLPCKTWNKIHSESDMALVTLGFHWTERKSRQSSSLMKALGNSNLHVAPSFRLSSHFTPFPSISVIPLLSDDNYAAGGRLIACLQQIRLLAKMWNSFSQVEQPWVRKDCDCISNVSWNVIKAHFRGNNVPNEIAKLVLEVRSKCLVLAVSPKECQIRCF